MKRHFSFILFSFCLSCNAQHQQKELPLDGSYYVIDLDDKKEVSLPLSLYFKNAQTIILETSKDCLIGDINEFQVFNGYIYVLDAYKAKSLYVFDIEGKFLRKIGTLGRGPGEYIQITDFTLDTENMFIFVNDWGNRIHKYQLDGTYVNSINLQAMGASIRSIQYYNSRLYLDVLPWDADNDKYMLVEIDPDDGKIHSRSLPLRYNKGWSEGYNKGESFFKSRLNTPPRYTQLFMSYVISVGETITPYIELKSKHLVTDNDIRNLPPRERSHSERFSRSFRGRSKIWNVNSFVENDDFIIFRYEIEFLSYNTVVFNKKTEIANIAGFLSNDLIFRRDRDGIFGRFHFSDTRGAYQILHPDLLNKIKMSIRRNEVVSSLDKADLLLKLNEDSNPVIFFYEFK